MFDVERHHGLEPTRMIKASQGKLLQDNVVGNIAQRLNGLLVLLVEVHLLIAIILWDW